ncbi:MAG: Mur ligase family protein [Polyangiaceae bacterium]
MRVHFVGVSGTGMGALALLFREAGHDVTGSDVNFDPPTGPALRAAGIGCLQGYDATHVGKPDLVVVGNAIRKDNAEAVAAMQRGLPRSSMSSALREHFMAKRKPLVVAGTHGKTTTATMCAAILVGAGLEPGWFIGGAPKNLPASAAIGRTKRVLAGGGPNAPKPGPSPFVVEGDEYDAVYWHKQPKFLDYVGLGEDDVAIVTSIEQDHIDIYPDVTSYESAFREFVRRIPPGGLVVCDAKDARVRAIVREAARCRVAFYALDREDTGDVTPTWLAAPSTVDEDGHQSFDVFVGGSSCGRFSMRVSGSHNVRNALAAIAACSEGFGVSTAAIKTALASFEGVKRRQDLLGEPGGIRVYDDFAHHPTAVDETLQALRARHPNGDLFAVFEPRSATACRALHQQTYVGAFGPATRVILAPLGRSNVPEAERLDLAKLAQDIGSRATLAASVESIVETLRNEAKPGDTIALLSNGFFGGIHDKLLAALASSSS